MTQFWPMRYHQKVLVFSSSKSNAVQECQQKVKNSLLNSKTENIKVNKCIIRMGEQRMKTTLVSHGITKLSWQPGVPHF